MAANTLSILRPSANNLTVRIGGDDPTIADIRFAASLEFLRAIDYELPQWAEDHLAAMESTLGDAYSEPTCGGYVASVKGPALA